MYITSYVSLCLWYDNLNARKTPEFTLPRGITGAATEMCFIYQVAIINISVIL